MKETIETLQKRLSELTNDLARINKIIAERPDSLNQLRPTLQALSEAVKDVHTKIGQSVSK